MDNLLYKPGDLFQAESGILAHACNCQGIWGAGVAAEFKTRFPTAFKSYRQDCLKDGESLRGQARFYTGLQSQRPQVYAVGCLFTSVGYGWDVDHPSDILDATRWAATHLVELARVQGLHIHSPKFNSGLFRVPWADTEAVLRTVLEQNPDVKWTVWTGQA